MPQNRQSYDCDKITSRRFKANLPTHIRVGVTQSGLVRDSIILLEQVRTLDKQRLKEKMGALDAADMARVDRALSVSLGIQADGSTVAAG